MNQKNTTLKHPNHPVNHAGGLADLIALNEELGRPSQLRVLNHMREKVWQKDLEASVKVALNSLPEDAGPLNSHGLLIRSLSVFQETSPHYLRRLVGLMSALTWLEDQR